MTIIKIWVLINLAFVALTLISPARSQEVPSPQVRALSDRVMTELNSSLVCSATVITLQDKIKELEAKLQPKKE